MHPLQCIRGSFSNARHASLEERTAPSHLPERCSAAKEITMSQTVADFVWMRLHAWGVRRVFGYPGDGIGGLMAALNRTGGAIDCVQVRHEEMAALMACATAKFAGEVGVCLATSGPGAQQSRSRLRDLGSAGAGRRSEVQSIAIAARRALRAFRRADRASGDPG